MATQYAHACRNLNLVRVLPYVPTYAQLERKPGAVRMGPLLWMKMLAVFDIFHAPTHTVKYMAFDPNNMLASFEILADHVQRAVTIGSYNYRDFRLSPIQHILYDVVPFARWGRVLWEHDTLDDVVAAVRARGGTGPGRCAPVVLAVSTILDRECKRLLYGGDKR